jgi:hypothetical protein
MRQTKVRVRGIWVHAFYYYNYPTIDSRLAGVEKYMLPGIRIGLNWTYKNSFLGKYFDLREIY